jgi:hypothetical protein
VSLLDTILNAQGGSAVQQLGAQLGLGSEQTASALSALVPALAAGVHQNAQSPSGLTGLLSALSTGQHARYVDDPSTLGQASTISDGNAILGHLFGTKDVSREVASQAAAQTGIGADILKQMMPMAAALVMGALSQHANASSTGGGALAASGTSPDLMSILGATLGQGSGGGGIAGGVAGMLGRFLSR